MSKGLNRGLLCAAAVVAFGLCAFSTAKTTVGTSDSAHSSVAAAASAKKSPDSDATAARYRRAHRHWRRMA